MTELTSLSLSEASALVRAKQASPTELTGACLSLIERLDPTLNAFITVTAEQAIAEAKSAEAEIMKGRYRGPLHGIPIGLKDLFDTAGVKTTAASGFFSERVPREDAEVVRRLKAAGAVILGKQNLQEFAYGTTSATSYYGPVHNPWNPEYVPGGSSGGSAAAVAASLGYGALGSDTGGSVRIPASFCGIVGFKPTYGRVSNRGAIPLAGSLDHVGPLTRTVLDAALLLQAVAGYDPQDPSSAEQPVPNFAAAVEGGASSLRIGVAREYFFADLNAEVLAAIEAALGVVAQLTAGIQDVIVPFDPEASRVVLAAEAFAFHAKRIKEDPERFQPAVLERLQQGAGIESATYVARRREVEALRRSAAALFEQVDLLVMPTVSDLPCSIEEAQIDELRAAIRYARNSRPFNSYGLPAISVPCGFSSNGFPIGLQIVGPPWGEEAVFRLAHAYEQATDWKERRPAQVADTATGTSTRRIRST